jgi:hypothetical protein
MKNPIQDADIVEFETSDGFCKNRCSKDKSDIGNCFCSHVKWMRIESGIDSYLDFKTTEHINELKQEYDEIDSRGKFGNKNRNKRPDHYSKESEAFKSLGQTKKIVEILRDKA